MPHKSWWYVGILPKNLIFIPKFCHCALRIMVIIDILKNVSSFWPIDLKKDSIIFFCLFSTLKNVMETLARRVIFVGIFKKVELFCLISLSKDLGKKIFATHSFAKSTFFQTGMGISILAVLVHPFFLSSGKQFPFCLSISNIQANTGKKNPSFPWFNFESCYRSFWLIVGIFMASVDSNICSTGALIIPIIECNLKGKIP